MHRSVGLGAMSKALQGTASYPRGATKVLLDWLLVDLDPLRLQGPATAHASRTRA